MPRDHREPGVRRSQLGSDGGVDDPTERQGCESLDVVAVRARLDNTEGDLE